ncbi:MAG: DUF1302 family protein [Myxococcota bacterium]|nr:DUF1302 family protein [Myxococcota bacterium]
MRGLAWALLALPFAALAPGPASAVGLDGPAESETETEPSRPAPLWTPHPKPRGLSYGGKLWTSVAPDLAMVGPYEDRFEWHSGLDFTLKYRFAPSARFVIGANFRYVLRAGDRVEADLWLDLGTTYLQFRKGKFRLRVGRFVHNWGRNTLLSPLNQLNPIDSVIGFSPEGASRARIPTLALQTNLNLHPVVLEAIWLPVYQPARTSFYGRDFSVFRPGMIEELLPTLVPTTGAGLVDDALTDAGQWLVDTLAGLDPYARDGIQSYLAFDRPEEFPWNGDIGARIGLTGRAVDADFVLFWHTLDSPELSLHEDLRRPLLENRLPDSGELTRLTNPDGAPITSTHHRSLLAGADIAVAAGGFVLSGEAAYNSKGVYYTREFESYVSPHFNYAVALRYNSGTTAAVTLEFSHDLLLRPEENTWLRDQHQLRLAFLGSLRLFSERLQVTFSLAWDILQQDLYVHPRLVVVVNDRLQVAFGASVFEGFRSDAGPSLDALRAYGGGPVGYFRGNDYAYGTVDVSF